MKALILIGQKASGKTTRAHWLARQLNCDWVDTDHQLLKEYGNFNESIQEFYSRVGVDNFRIKELEIARRYSESTCIMATGAGLVSFEPSRSFLIQHPWVVFWNVSHELCFDRLKKIKRPYLESTDPRQWKIVFEQRQPLYEKVSSFVARDVHELLETAKFWQNNLHNLQACSSSA